MGYSLNPEGFYSIKTSSIKIQHFCPLPGCQAGFCSGLEICIFRYWVSMGVLRARLRTPVFVFCMDVLIGKVDFPTGIQDFLSVDAHSSSPEGANIQEPLFSR